MTLPNPAQRSRVLSTCRAARSVSGVRAITIVQRPSQSAATAVKPKMRSVPSRSSRIAAGVSRHTVRRPTRSELSQLSAAVRISACLAAFSSTPSRPNTSMKADVQASPPVRRTSSPSTVNSTLRALSVPAAWRRSRVGGCSPRLASVMTTKILRTLDVELKFCRV